MTSNQTENSQSAYHVGHLSKTDNVERDIYDAMYAYLTLDLGIEPTPAEGRALAELSRETPKHVLAFLAHHGINIAGREVLELGAGLGGMSEELVLNGAIVTALEPGGAWARIADARLRRHGKDFQLLNAFGESIPLSDESVDLVISLQVLEHVRDPDLVLSEAYRVLRPGGHFYLACENYLAFVEPHYRVPWLPLLPKTLGKFYLQLIGRPPKFLEESITYTTYPSVIGKCRRLGFLRPRDVEIAKNLKSKDNTTWHIMRFLSNISGGRAPLFLDDIRNMFKAGIYELLFKPPNDLAKDTDPLTETSITRLPVNNVS